jgi:hypothetical protein
MSVFVCLHAFNVIVGLFKAFKYKYFLNKPTIEAPRHLNTNKSQQVNCLIEIFLVDRTKL